MFGLPSWLEIIVWVYLAGLVANLLTFPTAGYQLSRYGGTPFVRNWTERLWEIAFAVFWPFVWILILYVTRANRFGFPYHFVRTTIGSQRSMDWIISEGYWSPRQWRQS